MKTNKLIAAALLPLLFSCAKENIAPADKNAAEGNYVTINLAPDSDAVTRATFGDSEGISWQLGVKAGLIKEAKDWNPVESEPLDKIYPYNDPNNQNMPSTQASFKFSLAKSDYSGSYKFFYPYHSDAKYTGEENPYIRIPFLVDPNQSSGVGKSIDVFAVVSKDMVTLDSNNHDTPAETYYKVVGSYIRFLVYGKPGEKVKSISIQSEQTPSGLYYVNGNTNQLNGEAYTDYSKLVTVSVNGDYSTPATKSDAKGIYASVLPERSLKNTYTVLTDKGLYEFKSEKDVKFEFGSIKDVPLNLQHAKCKYLPIPDDLYIVGDVSFVGWILNNAIHMDKNGYIFTTDVYLNTQVKNGDSYSEAEGFKFLCQTTSFEPAYVNGGDNTLVYYNGEDSNKDKKFKVDKSGYYTVTADFSTGKVTCTPKAPKKFYVWGSATEAGWTSENAIPLDRDENDNFVFTKKDIKLKVGEYKFFSDNFETTAYVNDGNGNLVFFDSPSGTTDKDIKFKVAYDGTYDLTVDLKNNSVKCILTTIPQARVKTGTWTDMVQTEEPGVFKAEAWWIKRGDNNHDIQIRCGEKQYINSGYYKEVTFASRTESLTGMTFDVSAKDIADTEDDNAKYSWWINNDWCKVRYDIIFDSNKNTVTIKYVPAKCFWLVGDINNWTTKDDNYKAEVVDGVATWNIDVAEGSYTYIKICGEELYDTDLWNKDCEWYYSDAADGNVDVSAGGEFDVMSYNDDHKWYFPSGKYKVQFNANTFKLIVEKSN